MRDHRKLEAFALADELVELVYDATRSFPRHEMGGIISQIRRAAVSVPCNIVEGSARGGLREYIHFLNIAMASLREVGYLIDLSARLAYLDDRKARHLCGKHDQCARKLAALIRALRS